MNTPDEMQEHVDQEILGLVANYGTESVLWALALACRQASTVCEDSKDYGQSSVNQHYAHVLEGLLEA